MNSICLFFFAVLVASAAQAEWYNPFSWSEDPTATFMPTEKTLSALSSRQKAVVREGKTFYLDRGYVFEVQEGKPPVYVGASSDVTALVLYKNLVVALQSDGDVYLLAEPKGKDREWIDIGNNARKIAADDSSLYAFTQNKEVWRYKGKPGPVVINYIYIPMIINGANNTTTTIFIPYPYIAGHKVSFSKTPIRDVVNIRQVVIAGEKRVQVIKADKSVATLRL